MKVTKLQRRNFLRRKLSTQPVWALRALIKIYDNQTEDEKIDEGTKHENFIGFSGCDAYIMSSFAKQYLKYGRLSEKQMNLVYKYIPRYWRQVLDITDMEKLDKMIVDEYCQSDEYSAKVRDHQKRQLMMEIG